MNKFLFVISFTLFLPVLFADNKENHIGMAKFLGNETWNRCASLMLDKDADVYELSYERSGSMPLSPFSQNCPCFHFPIFHLSISQTNHFHFWFCNSRCLNSSFVACR